jgi:hypothetical protein
VSAIASRRTRRTAIALVAGIAVAALVTAGGIVGVSAIYNSKGTVSAVEDSIPLPSTPTALLATVDEGNRLTSVTALVLAEHGVGGSIVPVPVNADSTADSGPDRVSLQDVYATGGKDELVAAVESVLSITFGFSEVMDAAGTSKLLEPLAPIAVDLPADVIDAQRTGSPSVVLAKGAHALGAADVSVVLTSDATSLEEASRRPGIDAFWQGVVTAIGTGRSSGPAPQGPPSSFTDLVSRLFAGPTQTRSLEVTSFSAAENPKGADVELIDRPFAVFVFAAAAPGAMSAPAAGYVYRVEAPPGYEPEVKAVIAALLYLGDNVSSVSIAAKPQADTVAYVSPASLQLDEQIANGLFGDVSVQPIAHRIDGIDVDLVLGTTFLDAARTNPPVPSSTTAPADDDG